MLRFAKVVVIGLLACSSPPTVQPADSGADTAPEEDAAPATPIANAQLGDPGLGSIHAIDFGPNGLLVIGDGKKNRVVVVETGDTDPNIDKSAFVSIADFKGKVATALGGGGAATIEIADLAVNPISKKLYVVVRRSGVSFLLTVRNNGTIEKFDFSNVSYAAVGYTGASTGTTVVDIAWTDGGIVASGFGTTWTNSTVVTIDNAPFTHDATSALTTTKSYHRTHTAWETQAPIDRFIPLSEGGNTYIAAGFTCAPVVRFGVTDLRAGSAQTTGTTPFDLGPGKQIKDMVSYEKDGKGYLLIALVAGFATDFAARVDRDLAFQSTNIDTKAAILFNTDSTPLNPAATHQAAFDDVEKMTKQDDTHAIVFRGDGTLESAELP